jgi:hypothetical protein
MYMYRFVCGWGGSGCAPYCGLRHLQPVSYKNYLQCMLYARS